ncbi:hypothetical protein T4E_3504 [Trichinella pseudospiralis]|uniref:DUF5641 domain-containing protein n=1 Tax=Trichinella pseudospiralis TaxID=6337 RepID=A0A0V0XZF4_TRIPS|nr:hypothetical protein T4E_3504 [Trichinella pseudospiralis]
MRRKFVVALSGADLRSAVDDGERQLEHRPDRCLTENGGVNNEVKIAKSNLPRKQWPFGRIVQRYPKPNGILPLHDRISISGHVNAVTVLVGSEYGDGPVNWERGKHCRHVLCLELLGSSCAVFYLLVVLLTWFILVLPLLLAEVQSTGHESQNTVFI